MKVVPDTSVLIEGIISKEYKKRNISSVTIHEASLAELEHQANQGKMSGTLGLEEVTKIKEIFQDNLSFLGQRPRASDIKYANLGEIDASIRQLAFEEEAVLLTADKVQHQVALARGVKAELITIKFEKKKVKLESFFTDTTMSVHLRENTLPMAKRGAPGNWEFVEVKKTKMSAEDIKEIAKEIIEVAKTQTQGFIELDRAGSTVVQLGKYRIVITRPPFADGWEITAVRAVRQLNLEEYNLSEKLMERISKQAEGILIAGSPGMGKSTFSAALITHYAKQKKIVKTIEAPRDLVLPHEVTQYAISHGSSEEIHDVLLLSRPDYTLFDEMRNRNDFTLYADLRLAGIGLAGVIHGATPVDAIQRFVGKLELGIIPHVIDTVIFIKDGGVAQVLSLQMEVKVPSGMMEADLARPVIVVRDFESNKPAYELYTYGEETVLIPVKESKEKKGIERFAEQGLREYFQDITSDVEVELISPQQLRIFVPAQDIPKIIGKQGKNIQAIEEELGLSIDVEELKESSKKKSNVHSSSKRDAIPFSLREDSSTIVLMLSKQAKNAKVQIFAEGDLLCNAVSSKKAMLKVSKNSPEGKKILHALDKNTKLTVVGV